MSSEGSAEPGGDGAGSRRRSLMLVAGAVLVVAAVVAGVLVFGQDESEPAAPAKSRVEPLALGAEPIWTADRLAGRTMSDSPEVTIADDAALLRRHDDFSVLDMETGRVHWSVAGSGSGSDGVIPGLGGAAWQSWLDGPLLVSYDGAPVVLTAYSYPPDPRADGVALLAAETGEVLWRKDIPDLAWLGAADGRTALVATTPGGRDDVDDLGALKTVALDLGSGETRWEQTGVWPDAVSGDVAYGHRSLLRDASISDDTTVAALDLATGAQKWELSERLARSRLVLAAGDVALVEGSLSTELEGSAMEIVDADSGALLHGIGGESCFTDERTLITCAVQGERGDLSTFDIPRRTMTESHASVLGVTAVWRSRVFLEAIGGRGYSVDRTGVTVDEKLPGVVVAISDRYVMVDVPDEKRTEVYRLPG